LIELIEEEYGDLCFNTIMTRTAAIGRLSINGFKDNIDTSLESKPVKPKKKKLKNYINGIQCG